MKLRKPITVEDIARYIILLFVGVMIVAGLLAFFTSEADAAPRVCLVKQQAVVAAPVYSHVQAFAVPYQVNYFVGEAVRAEAIIEKKLRENPEWQEFQQFKAWRSMQAAGAAQVQGDTPPAPSPAAASLIKAKCATCHSGSAPKGGLLLDGTAPLDCEQTLAAMKAISNGTMPKGKPVTPEEAGALFQELLELSK